MTLEPVRPDQDQPERYISVASNGTWYIPMTTYEAFFEGDEHVAVAASDGLVAIRPIDDPDDFCDWPNEGDAPTTYSLARVERGGYRFASPAALTQADVDLDSSVRLQPHWDDDLDAIVVFFDRTASAKDAAVSDE